MKMGKNKFHREKQKIIFAVSLTLLSKMLLVKCVNKDVYIYCTK